MTTHPAPCPRVSSSPTASPGCEHSRPETALGGGSFDRPGDRWWEWGEDDPASRDVRVWAASTADHASKGRLDLRHIGCRGGARLDIGQADPVAVADENLMPRRRTRSDPVLDPRVPDEGVGGLRHRDGPRVRGRRGHLGGGGAVGDGGYVDGHEPLRGRRRVVLHHQHHGIQSAVGVLTL
jgi:hypothetical protein